MTGEKHKLFFSASTCPSAGVPGVLGTVKCKCQLAVCYCAFATLLTACCYLYTSVTACCTVCSTASACPPLQDSLGFSPSRQAMAVVQGFVQAQAARQQQWALSRLRYAAVLTARRCAAAPLYGQDVRKVCTPPLPTPADTVGVLAAVCLLAFADLQGL